MVRAMPAHPSSRPYSALEPFRERFAEGLPVLCYHKLGPLPPDVKMPSLYVSSELFAWQMRQLRDEGFASASLDEWRASAHEGRRIVITFDDGSRTLMRHALPVLAECGFRAIVYLVAGAIGGVNHWDVAAFGEVPDALMSDVDVREWLAAGHEIGAHTVTHCRLTRVPLGQAREEILASRHTLEDRFGVPVRHFCYPYGKWSPRVRGFVEEAGYETAVTLESGANTPAAEALALRRLSANHPARTVRNFFSLGRAGFPLRFFWQK